MSVSTIVICKSSFKSESEFYDTFNTLIQCLLKMDYSIHIRWDEPGLGIAVIEFDHNDPELATYHPMWLTIDEAEDIFCSRQNDSEN